MINMKQPQEDISVMTICSIANKSQKDENDIQRLMAFTTPLTFFNQIQKRYGTNKIQKLFCQNMTVHKVSPHHIVFQKGDEDEIFYLILEGAVSIVKRENGSSFSITKVVEKGLFFGELALINETFRSASAQNGDRTSYLACLHKNAFRIVFSHLVEDIFLHTYSSSIDRCFIVQNWSKREIHAFYSASFLIEVRYGNVLLRQQEVQADGILIVLSGEIQLFQSYEGEELSLITLHENDVLNEEQFMDASPPLYTSKCISPVAKLLFISNEEFFDKVLPDAEVYARLMANIERKQLLLRNRLIEIENVIAASSSPSSALKKGFGRSNYCIGGRTTRTEPSLVHNPESQENTSFSNDYFKGPTVSSVVSPRVHDVINKVTEECQQFAASQQGRYKKKENLPQRKKNHQENVGVDAMDDNDFIGPLSPVKNRYMEAIRNKSLEQADPTVVCMLPNKKSLSDFKRIFSEKFPQQESETIIGKKQSMQYQSQSQVQEQQQQQSQQQPEKMMSLEKFGHTPAIFSPRAQTKETLSDNPLKQGHFYFDNKNIKIEDMEADTLGNQQGKRSSILSSSLESEDEKQIGKSNKAEKKEFSQGVKAYLQERKGVVNSLEGAMSPSISHGNKLPISPPPIIIDSSNRSTPDNRSRVQNSFISAASNIERQNNPPSFFDEEVINAKNQQISSEEAKLQQQYEEKQQQQIQLQQQQQQQQQQYQQQQIYQQQPQQQQQEVFKKTHLRQQTQLNIQQQEIKIGVPSRKSQGDLCQQSGASSAQLSNLPQASNNWKAQNISEDKQNSGAQYPPIKSQHLKTNSQFGQIQQKQEKEILKTQWMIVPQTQIQNNGKTQQQSQQLQQSQQQSQQIIQQFHSQLPIQQFATSQPQQQIKSQIVSSVQNKQIQKEVIPSNQARIVLQNQDSGKPVSQPLTTSQLLAQNGKIKTHQIVKSKVVLKQQGIAKSQTNLRERGSDEVIEQENEIEQKQIYHRLFSNNGTQVKQQLKDGKMLTEPDEQKTKTDNKSLIFEKKKKLNTSQKSQIQGIDSINRIIIQKIKSEDQQKIQQINEEFLKNDKGCITTSTINHVNSPLTHNSHSQSHHQSNIPLQQQQKSQSQQSFSVHSHTNLQTYSSPAQSSVQPTTPTESSEYFQNAKILKKQLSPSDNSPGEVMSAQNLGNFSTLSASSLLRPRLRTEGPSSVAISQIGLSNGESSSSSKQTSIFFKKIGSSASICGPIKKNNYLQAATTNQSANKSPLLRKLSHAGTNSKSQHIPGTVAIVQKQKIEDSQKASQKNKIEDLQRAYASQPTIPTIVKRGSATIVQNNPNQSKAQQGIRRSSQPDLELNSSGNASQTSQQSLHNQVPKNSNISQNLSCNGNNNYTNMSIVSNYPNVSNNNNNNNSNNGNNNYNNSINNGKQQYNQSQARLRECENIDVAMQLYYKKTQQQEQQQKKKELINSHSLDSSLSQMIRLSRSDLAQNLNSNNPQVNINDNKQQNDSAPKMYESILSQLLEDAPQNQPPLLEQLQQNRKNSGVLNIKKIIYNQALQAQENPTQNSEKKEIPLQNPSSSSNLAWKIYSKRAQQNE